MVTFHVVTLFPESLESYLGASIVKRAQERKKIAIKYYNPRDFAEQKKGAKKGAPLTYSERRVDDRPYGGGPGMVLEALPIIKAIERAVGKKMKTAAGKKKVKIVFFNPGGEMFTNTIADSLKVHTDIVFVCGRYEGIDARVKKVFPMVDISVGDYTLTGGELPAMVLIDAITRRIPGVLGDDLSVEEARVASRDVYTRPAVIEYKKKKYKVPEILMSGHHAQMDAWKMKRNEKGLPKNK